MTDLEIARSLWQWTSEPGDTFTIDTVTTPHLVNIANWVRDNPFGNVYDDDCIMVIDDEIHRRQWRNFAAGKDYPKWEDGKCILVRAK